MKIPALGAVSALLLCLLPTSGFAQGTGVLTPSPQGYVWTRGPLRFELINRHATWGPNEVLSVQESLDKLPDVLLAHAMRMNVTKLHRDDVPRRRLGIKANGIATTVVEAGSISFGDRLFVYSPAQIYRTVTHEFGHVAQYAITGLPAITALVEVLAQGTPGFTPISWALPVFNGLRSHNGFVSNYARTNLREDFAESVEFYWINPDELRRVSPGKYAFIRDRVFAQLDSPPSSRDLSHRAIGPVTPVVTSLSKTRGGHLSLVRVRGEYFMGPLDGGFNRVEFRAKTTLHLPISHTTLFTWVPSLSAGSAPMTLTTQDGSSAPQPFDATRPWWRFW